MAYEEHRFLNNNFITDSDMITASSQATGFPSGTQKDGTGSAAMVATGDFSGPSNLVYLVQVYNIDAGANIGEALLRWRSSETPEGQWEASGITTSTSNISLNYNISIRFIEGTGDDFVINDDWTFRGVAPFQVGHLLDMDRGTIHQSGELETPNTYVIDFGEAKTFDTICLFDHNIFEGYEIVDVDGNQLVDVDGNDLVTQDSTIVLEANSSDSWGAPPFQQTLSISNPYIIEYLSSAQTYQFVRWVITDYGNPDFALKIGEMYVGDHLQVECNADWQSGTELLYYTQGDVNTQGVQLRQVFSEQTIINLTFSVYTNDEYDNLVSILRQIFDVDSGKVTPMFFHLFNDEYDTFFMMNIEPTLPKTFEWVDVNSTSLQLNEVVKTRFQ